MVREYVDLVQEEHFDYFFRFVQNKQLRGLIKDSLLLERWALLSTFALQLEEKHRLIKNTIKGVARLLL